MEADAQAAALAAQADAVSADGHAPAESHEKAKSEHA